MNVIKHVRNFDIYGIRVGLTYKGNLYYTTILGGLVSLLYGIFCVCYAYFEFMKAYSDPEYLLNPVTYNYLSNRDTTDETWTMGTDQNIVAVKFASFLDPELD